MNRITYLLSERFPYEKTIHADAGPGYARRHRWPAAPLSTLRDAVQHGPVLIDNRVTDAEMTEINRILPELRHHPLYVKAVDPYWECIQHRYYHWLLTLTRFDNVCFIGPYQATSLTALLVQMSRADAYVHMPYAYEDDRELPLDLAARAKFLAFSGAAHPTFYPERAAMLHAMRRHWWAARKVSVLPHPGYPDVGQIAKHTVTGENYLRFLAAHRFMYLEPSRDGLEFLKYSECAYAGCVPVGRAPGSFDRELRELILPLESAHLPRDLGGLRALPIATGELRARAYREQLKHARDPASLSALLVAHWKAQTTRLAGSR